MQTIQVTTKSEKFLFSGGAVFTKNKFDEKKTIEGLSEKRLEALGGTPVSASLFDLQSIDDEQLELNKKAVAALAKKLVIKQKAS